jgi:aminopeptidase-like protein
MNVISYLDGKSDLLDIAEKCQISYEEVLKIVEDLINHKLLEKV